MTNLIQQLRNEVKNRKKDKIITPGDIIDITTTSSKNKKPVVRGVCLGISRKEGSTTVRIRSTIGGEGVEHTYILESTTVNNIHIIGRIARAHHSKLYYLRTKAPSESKIHTQTSK